MKDALIGAAVGFLASIAFTAAGYLIYGWNLGPVAEMEISEAFGGFMGWPTALIAAAVLLILSVRPSVSYIASIIVVALAPMSITIYEMVHYPKSHNLFPFEFAIYLVGSAVLHLPALILKGIPRIGHSEAKSIA